MWLQKYNWHKCEKVTMDLKKYQMNYMNTLINQWASNAEPIFMSHHHHGL